MSCCPQSHHRLSPCSGDKENNCPQHTTNQLKQFCCLSSGFAERVSKLRSGGLDNLAITAQDRALRNWFTIVSDFVCLSAALSASLRKRDVKQLNKPTRESVLWPAFLVPNKNIMFKYRFTVNWLRKEWLIGWRGQKALLQQCKQIFVYSASTATCVTPPPRKAATFPAGGRYDFFMKSLLCNMHIDKATVLFL